MVISRLFLFFSLFITTVSAMEHDVSHLNDLQKHVTMENGTEPAFNNTYWNNKEQGIYVDVITGKPLFSSKEKYDSGTGWPSFYKPLHEEEVKEKKDTSHGMVRTEIKSSESGAHLGHVFPDGPKEHGGKRYCVNSAALKFVPASQLKDQGYEQYVDLFENPKKQDNDAQTNFIEEAYFAGGCFWGMEDLFSKIDGVLDVVNGYSGGTIDSPSYNIVKTGATGHAETIKVTFNPNIISYQDLVRFFFKIHDPTTKNRQKNDVGPQYRSAIFYRNDTQKDIALKVMQKANGPKAYKGKVVTELSQFKSFHTAEDYHQDYLKNNPNGYTCHFIRDDITLD